MVRLRLKQLAKEKGIKHLFTALTKAGISDAVATEYMKGNKDRLVMEHIEILCLIFRCMPNDLFEVVPDKPGIADFTQPVYTLKHREDFDLLKTTEHLTPDEIKQALEDLKKKKEEEEKKKKEKEEDKD